MSAVLAVEFQSNWLEVLQSSFMRNALIGGSLLAVRNAYYKKLRAQGVEVDKLDPA